MPLVVGRAEDAGLRLEAAGISRHHARLTPTDEGLIVEDLGSANGTYLNGRRIPSELARNGEEIAFDTLRFQVVAPGTAAGASPGEAQAAVAAGRLPAWAWGVAALAVLALGWLLLR